jgi:transcriptional regulator with XRE-family HTH domain
MTQTRRELIDEFKDREFRESYAEAFLNASIAIQIRANRERRELTQKQLAHLAGMKHQPRICDLEGVDYGKYTLTTLKRLARAFDMALTVNFRSYGELIQEIEGASLAQAARPPFSHDPVFLPAAGMAANISGRPEQIDTVSRQIAAEDEETVDYGRPTRGESVTASIGRGAIVSGGAGGATNTVCQPHQYFLD